MGSSCLRATRGEGSPLALQPETGWLVSKLSIKLDGGGRTKLKSVSRCSLFLGMYPMTVRLLLLASLLAFSLSSVVFIF